MRWEEVRHEKIANDNTWQARRAQGRGGNPKNRARSCEAHHSATREISMFLMFLDGIPIQERVILLFLPLVTYFQMGEEMACLRPQGSELSVFPLSDQVR